MYEYWVCVCVCVGLQYVWEYRSPSKTVPPHYQCRLCKVQLRQYEMASHVTGWKHCFKYLVRLVGFKLNVLHLLLPINERLWQNVSACAIKIFRLTWKTETCSPWKNASWRRGSKEPSYQKGTESDQCWGGEDWGQRSNQGRSQWVYIFIMPCGSIIILKYLFYMISLPWSIQNTFPPRSLLFEHLWKSVWLS